MKKVHFLGIGGSGMNAVAGIAHAMGYAVDGCDAKESEYWEDLKSKNISITIGHDPIHLKDTDVLCITPAVLHQKEKPEEYSQAMDRGIPVMTWQEFMGKVLQKEKEVVAISGTKGKTTTTALVGRLMEIAGLDPTVEVGGKVLDWERNYRVGNSSHFVCEADEFNNNFSFYQPKVGVITNIEMDHPEFFASEEEYHHAFLTFARTIRPDGTLIVNNDSPGVQLFLRMLGEYPVKLVKYGLTADDEGIQLLSVMTLEGITEIKVGLSADNETVFRTSMPGDYNVSNILAMVAVAKVMGIAMERVQKVLDSFQGIGRRFELVCDKKGIKVYNDYAHNPMSVNAVLQGARQKYPDARIWAVFQPHMYTRTKQFLDQYAKSFNNANEVIILDIFASREKDLPIAQEIDSQMVVDKIYNFNPKLHVRSIPDKNKAVEVLLDELKAGDVVVNMGAGDNGIITELLDTNL